MFQSAPRSHERGDRRRLAWAAGAACFNPRPALTSGATLFVNIPSIIHRFQSAPRSHERGDMTATGARRHWLGFNPRPALTSGATRYRPRPRQSNQFQSAPRSHERGDWTSLLQTRTSRVSIRAPLSRAGRRGPANQQNHKPLLRYFRAQDELFVAVEYLVVKERGKMCSGLGVRASREINRASPALGVRGRPVIG